MEESGVGSEEVAVAVAVEVGAVVVEGVVVVVVVEDMAGVARANPNLSVRLRKRPVVASAK